MGGLPFPVVVLDNQLSDSECYQRHGQYDHATITVLAINPSSTLRLLMSGNSVKHILKVNKGKIEWFLGSDVLLLQY